MAHARIILQRAYDVVEALLAAGDDVTDAAIAERARCDVDSVRSILADLADAGRITIKGFGDERKVTLGRTRSTFAAAKPVAASVVRRDEAGARISVHPETVLANPHSIHVAQRRNREGMGDKAAVEAAAAKIKEIVARGAKAKPAAACPPPPPPPPPAPVTSTAPIEPVAPKVSRLPTAPSRSANPLPSDQPRQVNVKLPVLAYAELERRATDGQLPSQVMREIVLRALSDTAPASAPVVTRPIITAAMTAAAVRDDIPVCDFVAMLLARGFASYEHDASLERCA